MLHAATTIAKLVLLPTLLLGSFFTRFAGKGEHLLDILICLAAIVVVPVLASAKKYNWALGLGAIAIVFSPLALVVKVFLLMGITFMATTVLFLGAWKTHAKPAA